MVGRSFSRANLEAPDDGNLNDRTVMRTPLPFAVTPGQTVEISLAFVSTLPRLFAMRATLGDFYMVAQWFPAFGVLDGRTARWNCHQYHANSEFFSDYGHCRVAITVPKGVPGGHNRV